MKVNHNTICKEGIKILLPRVGFSFHGNELFNLILISKCNPNRVVNEKWNGLSILTPPSFNVPKASQVMKSSIYIQYHNLEGQFNFFKKKLS